MLDMSALQDISTASDTLCGVHYYFSERKTDTSSKICEETEKLILSLIQLLNEKPLKQVTLAQD